MLMAIYMQILIQHSVWIAIYIKINIYYGILVKLNTLLQKLPAVLRFFSKLAKRPLQFCYLKEYNES